MRLIDRYILKEFILYFFSILSLLVLIFYVAEFLRGESDVSSAKLMIYNGMLLPQIALQIMAPAAMLATMATFSILNRRNELIAMQAGGIGLPHLTFLIFTAVFILSCISLIVNDRVVPPLAQKRTLYLWREIKGRKDFSLDIKSSKIWYRSQNYIYNLKTFDKANNAIQGFGVYFLDQNFQLKEYIEAKSAVYENNGWKLQDGMLALFPSPSTFPLLKKFKEKQMDLPVSPHDFGEIEKQVDALRLKELLAFIRRNRESGLNTKTYEVDFHSRVSLSFIPIVMALLVIPYSVRPRRQAGIGKDISFCISMILVYWIIFSIALSFGRSGAIEPWIAVWAPSLLFLMIAVFITLQKKH